MIATATTARPARRLSAAFRAALTSRVEIDAERDLFAAVETDHKGAKQVVGAGMFDEMKDLANLVCFNTGHCVEVIAVVSVKLAAA